MRSNVLTLYRRHSRKSNEDGSFLSLCSKGYEQDHRILRPRTPKELKADCGCPIVANGALENEPRRVRYRSLNTNNWDEAEALAAKWLEWGQSTEPEPETPTYEDVSVEFAVNEFLTDFKANNPNAVETQKKYDVLLTQRLLPWCKGKRLTQLRRLEDLTTLRHFFNSWVNLNPTRNRTDVAVEEADLNLAVTSKREELRRFRAFMRFSLKNGFMAVDHSPELKVKGEQVEERYGFDTEAEYERVLNEARAWGDSHGKADGLHARQLQVLVQLMRWSGLRISDAAMLAEDEIIPRAGGDGYAIKKVMLKLRHTKKPGVYVPIPLAIAQMAKALPIHGERDGRRYYFWTCEGEADTCIKNWANDVTTCIQEATRKEPFKRAASPHTFRHHFACSGLVAGRRIEDVSRWLGHSSTKITEKYYIHAVSGLLIASEKSYDEMHEHFNQLAPRENVLSIRQGKTR